MFNDFCPQESPKSAFWKIPTSLIFSYTNFHAKVFQDTLEIMVLNLGTFVLQFLETVYSSSQTQDFESPSCQKCSCMQQVSTGPPLCTSLSAFKTIRSFAFSHPEPAVGS